MKTTAASLVLAAMLLVASARCQAAGVAWVLIPGGQFSMGSDDDSTYFTRVAQPVHAVRIRTFEMSRTPVTVRQYAECWMADPARCTEPGTGEGCNWKRADRLDHPVNCITWTQAAAYAKFMGARLPSESEWEYAAKSGGKAQRYPWGDEPATCERAVMMAEGAAGCGSGGTLPVCSKPAGNTERGLCDMAGNVEEWVQDKVSDSYAGAPADGSAFEGKAAAGQGEFRALRGGSFAFPDPQNLRADYRHGCLKTCDYNFIGFRLARDHRRPSKSDAAAGPQRGR